MSREMAGRLLRKGDVERKGAMVVALIWAAVAHGVVWGAEAAVEPAAGPSGHDERCSRPLIDVLQGFAITLLAVAVSMWGKLKHVDKAFSFMLWVPLMGMCTPFIELGHTLYNSGNCVVSQWRCNNFRNDGLSLSRSVKWKRLFVSLLPWEKSRVRILASCDMVLYISPDSMLLENARFKHMTRDNIIVRDESEAMKFGDPKIGYTGREILYRGRSALELALGGVLPPYDELKFLRGNSSFAMAAIAIQAIGYIYAVVYRTITGLQVAPVEVIGLVINIVLLIKGSLFFVSNACHRPLVIYMDEEKEEMLNTFLSKDSADVVVEEYSLLRYWASGITTLVIVFVGVILVYYIVRMKGDVDKTIIIPLVLSLVGCVFGAIQMVTVYMEKEFLEKKVIVAIVSIIVSVLNGIGYIWAIVVTIQHWNSENFNVRAELLNISQLIPFIG